MQERIHNRNILKQRRKQLRNSLTPAEAKLWSLIKDSQLENRKFRRQHSVGPYVLDFYCPSEKLCIEMDGAGHFTDGGYEYDGERTEYLRNRNIKVVRFAALSSLPPSQPVRIPNASTTDSDIHP